MSVSMIDDTVKAKVRVEQVLSHYGFLVRFRLENHYLVGPCPLHKNNEASLFFVNLKKNTWTCYGECKHGGHSLGLIAILENITMEAAAIKALHWFNVR